MKDKVEKKGNAIQQIINLEFEKFNSINELNESDKQLLLKAIDATSLAYSPYSGFKVGCAGITNKGSIILGSNQENASYPVTICGEITLLATLSTTNPGEYLTTLAIGHISQTGQSNCPITPCGLCRQALLEHETLHKHNIRLILGGTTGDVWIIKSISDILPMAFGSNSLK
jgi:cytidine deaminase